MPTKVVNLNPTPVHAFIYYLPYLPLMGQVPVFVGKNTILIEEFKLVLYISLGRGPLFLSLDYIFLV